MPPEVNTMVKSSAEMPPEMPEVEKLEVVKKKAEVETPLFQTKKEVKEKKNVVVLSTKQQEPPKWKMSLKLDKKKIEMEVIP